MNGSHVIQLCCVCLKPPRKNIGVEKCWYCHRMLCDLCAAEHGHTCMGESNVYCVVVYGPQYSRFVQEFPLGASALSVYRWIIRELEADRRLQLTLNEFGLYWKSGYYMTKPGDVFQFADDIGDDSEFFFQYHEHAAALDDASVPANHGHMSSVVLSQAACVPYVAVPIGLSGQGEVGNASILPNAYPCWCPFNAHPASGVFQVPSYPAIHAGWFPNASVQNIIGSGPAPAFDTFYTMWPPVMGTSGAGCDGHRFNHML